MLMFSARMFVYLYVCIFVGIHVHMCVGEIKSNEIIFIFIVRMVNKFISQGLLEVQCVGYIIIYKIKYR